MALVWHTVDSELEWHEHARASAPNSASCDVQEHHVLCDFLILKLAICATVVRIRAAPISRGISIGGLPKQAPSRCDLRFFPAPSMVRDALALVLQQELPISFPRDGGVARFRASNAAMHGRVACLLPCNPARPDTEAVR